MKLRYATTARLPTVQAHGMQIVENCAAFAALDVDVTLAVADRSPDPDLAVALDPRDHYRVGRTFAIERLPCLEPGWRAPALQPTAFRLMAATFGLAVLASTRRHGSRTLTYSRDPIPLLIASAAIPAHRLVYEAHQLPPSRQGRRLHEACVRRVGLVVAVTESIAAAARAAGARGTVVARDGYRSELFADLPPRAAARHELGLPPDAFIVGYVGRLHTMGMAKGVEQLLDAAARLRDIPATVAVVGGPEDQVEELRRRWRDLQAASELLIAPGQVPPESVPVWLAALDVGTIPFPSTPHFAHCASPLKLFEYLAAGLPIVASDLPALAEVLTDGETALLVPPADVETLASALRRIWQDRELRARLAAAARQAAHTYAWSTRARSILDAIRTRAP